MPLISFSFFFSCISWAPKRKNESTTHPVAIAADIVLLLGLLNEMKAWFLSEKAPVLENLIVIFFLVERQKELKRSREDVGRDEPTQEQ